MAAKNLAWTGAVSGNWETAGNWTDPTDTGPPNTDASKDTLIFLKTATVGPTENVDRTQDGTAQNGLNPLVVYVEKGATYDIGAAGAPLMIRPDKFIYRGNGTLFYQSAGTTGSTGDMIINSDNNINAAQLDDDGTVGFARIAVAKGNVTLAAGMLSVSKLNIGFRNSPTSDAVVAIGASGNDVTLCSVAGGTLTSAMNIATLFQTGGLVTVTAGSPVTIVVAGGKYVYNVAGGSISQLHAMGGIADIIASEATLKTIVRLFKFPGGVVLKDQAGEIITVGTYHGFGEDTE